MSRNRAKRQVNGEFGEESPTKTIKRLAKQLSNTERELQLSDQIRSQLEKIRVTSGEVKDITHKLLYDIADLTDKEIGVLHKKEEAANLELKKLETRLQMLRDIESKDSVFNINVKFLDCKKSNKKDVFVVKNKEYSLLTNIDKEATDDEDTEEESESAYGPTSHSSGDRNRHSSNATDSKSQDSWQSFEIEGELKDLKPHRTGRKTAIPTRFESFPSGVKKRSNGIVIGSLFLVLALIISVVFIFSYRSLEVKPFQEYFRWQSAADYLQVLGHLFD